MTDGTIHAGPEARTSVVTWEAFSRHRLEAQATRGTEYRRHPGMHRRPLLSRYAS